MSKEEPPDTLAISEADRHAAAPPAAQATPYPEPTTPQTGAFVPPELLARRRAATPSSTPYQPIAGWSVAQPPAPQQAPVQPPPAQTGAMPPPPANGFASGPRGGPGAPSTMSSSPALGTPSGPGPSRGSSRRPAVLVIGAAALVGVLVVGAIALNARGNKDPETPPAAATPTATATAAPVAVKFSASSYDPAPGGSGFREKGSTWVTATYNTTEFGNLKDGVGLVLDLGSAKELASVGFTAKTDGLSVELRAADELPSGQSAGEQVGKGTSASGKTTLDAAGGGKHQYWMIYVSELGPDRRAEISDLTVSAVASAS